MKFLGVIFLGIILIGAVVSADVILADSDTSVRVEKRMEAREELGKINNETREIIKSALEERNEKIMEMKERMSENRGIFNVSGKNITVRELSEEQRVIIAGRINAKTGLNLTAEDIGNGTRGEILRVYLSNGRNAEIKYMPNTASAVALKRLRAKCEERNCSVELREVGEGNRTRVAYRIQTEKDSRVLFIFKNKMNVSAEVDAETGEVISVKKPWWAFMAKEDNATDAEIETETEN